MVDEEGVSLLEGATVTANIVQRNRDPPPTASGTPRWDTDKVIALMLRSHTVVLASPVEAPGSVAWKKACPVPVEQEWRVGLCANPP